MSLFAAAQCSSVFRGLSANGTHNPTTLTCPTSCFDYLPPHSIGKVQLPYFQHNKKARYRANGYLASLIMAFSQKHECFMGERLLMPWALLKC